MGIIQQAERLPGYELGELLYEGATSAVHRARRLADGAPVVVKRTIGKAVSALELTRYRNEYELLRSIPSDGVVKAHDLLRTQTQLALVLEGFDGKPLKHWLASAPPLLERLRVAIALAVTIGEVHAAGVIHKDVNSHNVLYDPVTRRCKLIDFGIATRLHSEESKFQFPTALEGTLAYIAPEQTGRMNRSVDHRADWYSFGVTLYELLVGRLPHESDDPLETVHFHIAGRVTPPHERDDAIPEALSAIVLKLLQKAPEDRYQSAAGVVADLRRCEAELAAAGRIERFPLGTADVIHRFEPPQKLYGRGRQTAALLAAFERVARGNVEAVLISGGAGIGKTSLVQEIHQPITRSRGYFAAGKFDQLQRDVPFSALVGAFQDLVEQLLTESEESIARWREAIQRAVGVNGQVLVEVIPALDLIIGPQPRVPPLPGFEAQNRFKHVFQSFIQVFAKRAHPLVLFLDDMQWADPASINLVTLILSAHATESLLVVEAYRDGEVTPTHPFMMAVKEQESLGVRLTTIALEPLEARDIAELVADTVRQPVGEAAPLAAVVHEKTGGNPFFMRQFLQSLYAEKLIAFDADRKTFGYDVEAVKRAAITENVAELLSSKLDRLPDASRRALRCAAAIGNRFDLETLAMIEGATQAEAAALLAPALAAGLIVPVSRLESLEPEALDAPLVYRRFAFLHDRVQRAAYDTLPPEERPALHLAIGRVLRDASSGEQRELRLFDIVNHMNLGAALLERREERIELAKLNLQAGSKARNATAYGLAVRSYRNAVELLGPEGWTEHEALACDAHAKLAEALCVTGDYEAAFAVLDETLARTSSAVDRLRLLAQKVVAFLSMGRMPEALACGREAAEAFGVELPADAQRAERMLESEIEAILERTAAIGIERLVDLPVMEDPALTALMALLTHCLPAAYQTDQQLFALICCKMVMLSLEHGNCSLSARAYGSFGGLLSSRFQRYDDAYRFTKLGVDVAQRLDDPSVFAGAYFLWGMFASHWVRPVDESIEFFRQSVEHGLQTGDHLHAGYSAARRVSHQQYRGMDLRELHQEATRTLELLERLSDYTNIAFLEPRIRMIEWLQGKRPQGNTLGSATETEEQCTAAIRARGNRSFESDWFILLTQQRYLAGEIRKAYELARESERLLPFSAAFITRVEHTFYYALIMAALLPTADAAERPELERALDACAHELAGWAQRCPPNVGHMHLLVEAERARVAGRTLDAQRLYDDAIAAAAEQGFVNVEGLAAELAARFWLAAGKRDFGQLYLEKALHAYDLWGAQGRADDLRREHGLKAWRKPASSFTTGAAPVGGERSDALDLATVLKASQAISSEIVLERLLARLMDIILENAGGERAVLVLESGGEYLVQGVKDAESERVMLAEPLRETARLPRTVVNYVLRTAEHVVLDDASQRGKYRNDPYVRNRRTKSVLCAPILHKGKITGVVYLENDQVSAAFTPGRLEALNVLMAQIAVSIENATLYSRQEQQARSIELANEALTREIAERVNAERELSRYKDHLEDLVAQRTRELESAQGRLVELSRRAGMAEVASGVLHNVGNVMNSVNVGANVVRDKLKAMPVERLGKVCELLDRNAGRLGEYLTADASGRKVPEYLRKLAQALEADKAAIRAEIDEVLEHLEHMKKIIAAQQTYAKANGVTEVCSLADIVENALAINEASLRGSRIEVIRRYERLPPALLDRHQIMQILVNLISNARHALQENAKGDRKLTLTIAADGAEARIEVADNGVGIPGENLAKIFNHGFTTKKTGHGFGLHNCANAAQQMRGSLEAFSDGPGKGARFVLRIPMQYASDGLQAGAA